MLHEGGQGVAGGFGGAVLLEERKREVVVRGPVGGRGFERVAPGGFGGGEVGGAVSRAADG